MVCFTADKEKWKVKMKNQTNDDKDCSASDACNIMEVERCTTA